MISPNAFTKTYEQHLGCISMFGLFKTKSPLEKLQAQHAQLLKEAFELSKTNRKASDQKTAEADEVAKQIEALQKA